MSKSYKVVKLVNAVIEVEYTEDSHTVTLLLPLPPVGQTLEDHVRKYWPRMVQADSTAVTGMIGQQVELPPPAPPTAPALTLDQIKQIQIGVLYKASSQEASSGFQSDALGATFTYPSSLNDQLNMTASALDAVRPLPAWQANHDYEVGDLIQAGPLRLTCATAGTSGDEMPTKTGSDGTVTWDEWTTIFKVQDAAGNWQIRPHTADQLIKAATVGKNFQTQIAIKLAGLVEQVNAATTTEQVQAISWADK